MNLTNNGKFEVNRNIGDRVVEFAGVNTAVQALDMLDGDTGALLSDGGGDLDIRI